MRKTRRRKETWEAPSLEWVHDVRRRRRKARRGRTARPISRAEAEALARRYGLKLARPTRALR
jgi:hypothetical protein